MKKLYYATFILGLILLSIGIITSLMMEDCYDKTPQEFYESRMCKWLIKR